MQVKFFSSIAFIIVSLILLLQNMEKIAVRFLFFSFNISLSIFILLLLAFGSIITIGMMVFKELQYKRMLSTKNREIFKLKKEISKLNNASFGQGIDSMNPSEESESVLTSDDLEILFERNLSVADEKLDFERFITETKKKKNPENTLDKDSASKKVEDSPKKTMDSLITGFDDLDDANFSLKGTLPTQKIKEDLPWYMAKSAASVTKKESISSKEKYQTKKIHLKNSYHEYLSKLENKDDDDDNKKPPSSHTPKKGKRMVLSQKKHRKKQVVHKKLQNSPSIRMLSPLKKVEEAEKKTNTQKLPMSVAPKKLPYQIEIELTADNLIDETFPEHSIKDTIKNASFMNEPADFGGSFLTAHQQKTDPDKTLSRDTVKEKFNWKYELTPSDSNSALIFPTEISKEESHSISVDLLKEKICQLFSFINLFKKENVFRSQYDNTSDS